MANDMRSDMAEGRFLEVKTSQFVPLNPDTSPTSVPVNAYFEFTVSRSIYRGTGKEKEDCGAGAARAKASGGGAEAVGAKASGCGAGAAGKEKAGCAEGGSREALRAKKAPTVRISGLWKGSCPMFGSAWELETFTNLLILDSQNWIKRCEPEEDFLELIYKGGTRTLPEDFELRAWCNSTNSMAANRGRTVLRIESWDFSQQFDDAADDDYSISIRQVYVPRITAFGPKDLSPMLPGGREYFVERGREVLLTWEIRGDDLRSPVLTRNNEPGQTVSPDTPVKCVIQAPCAYGLRVESNLMSGVWNEQRIFFGITSGPAIAYFEAEKEFCLPGQAVKLKFATMAAGNRIITATGSTEESIEVPAGADCAVGHPALGDEAKRRVIYMLTASGYRGTEPASVTALACIEVSRWKKRQGTWQLPRFGKYDGTAEVFNFLDWSYCFAGGLLWRSKDGTSWEKLSGPVLPQGAEECQVSVGLCETEIYVFCGALNGSLLYARFSLVNNEENKWSQCLPTGISKAFAGAALCFPGQDHQYCITYQDTILWIWDYYEPPFANWGQVGSLKVPAAIRGTAAVCDGKDMYLAAACDNGYTYIHKTDAELGGALGDLVKVQGDTGWVRLLRAEGTVYAVTEKGMYDIRCRKWEDMLFDPSPRMLGLAGENLAGIAPDGGLWSRK